MMVELLTAAVAGSTMLSLWLDVCITDLTEQLHRLTIVPPIPTERLVFDFKLSLLAHKNVCGDSQCADHPDQCCERRRQEVLVIEDSDDSNDSGKSSDQNDVYNPSRAEPWTEEQTGDYVTGLALRSRTKG